MKNPETKSRNKAEAVGKRILAFTLAGLPELELLDTLEERDAVLNGILTETTPLKSVWWKMAVIVLPGTLAAVEATKFALRRVDWPPAAEGLIIAAILTSSLILLLRLAHRRILQRGLRRQLIRRGIPVCMACGYCLRGQPNHPRCPECGRNETSPG